MATAQITQTIRGRVTDATTNKPLVGASVQLDSFSIKMVSNTEGGFRLENVAVGRHILQVSFVGFETVSLPELLLESGKELVIDIPLNTLTINVDEVTVIAQRSRDISPINGIRNERLSRYPATFNDPARLLTYLPGAATDNDQGNNISVRGSSPNMNQWYLEGAEIVNPNHLSNAGTSSDRATVNGGGVLIPGFNVIEGMNFYKGAMSADLGGALTSVMDIRLRKGNDERRENQVSIGLTGLEVGTEGKFSKKSKASYLIHYRYSTVGLLSKLGVPLGDEAINYQDLVVNVNLPTHKAGTFNLFGMYGTSENVFKHLPSKTDWLIDKDSQDITFTNKMGVAGLRHELSIGLRGRLSTVVAYSGLENERIAVGYGVNNLPLVVRRYQDNPTKLFIKSMYNYAINAKNALKIALMVRKDGFDYNEKYQTGSTNLNASSFWLQPSLEWQGKFGKNWTTNVGLRVVQWNYVPDSKKNQTNLEPMANVSYRFDNNSVFHLGYSLQSQMVSPQLYLANDRFFIMELLPNYSENITQSHNYNLNYYFNLTKNIKTNIEAYYQDIFEASTLTLNQFETIHYRSQSATGRNVGIEIDLQQQLTKGFYWRANVSLYDAKYKTTTTWLDTRFNGHYITNALIGKEWTRGSMKNKFLGVNAHVLLRGGFLDVYTNQKLKDYFRTDLNVYWKKSHNHYSSTVQLDLQNVTNQQNEGWRYYDAHQGRILTKYQLGLIPNLAYKVEF